MNILLAVFFSAALQTSGPCFETSGKSNWLRSVTARLQRPVRDETGLIGAPGAERRGFGVSETNGNREDLLFYFSSHAQAVNELSEASWTPWLWLLTFVDRRRDVCSDDCRVTHLTLGGGNGSCGLTVTIKDAREKRLASLHEPRVISSSSPARSTGASKR